MKCDWIHTIKRPEKWWEWVLLIFAGSAAIFVLFIIIHFTLK